MIFVTVGHQLPFDRLVRLVDGWAGRRQRADVFAQIGRAQYQPRHVECAAFLSAAEFDRRLRQCNALVGHAGTGCIIQALCLAKPVLVLARLASLDEALNDHQLATARHFAAARQVLMARDDAEFVELLDAVEAFRPAAALGRTASPQLMSEIRQFLGSAR